MAEERPVGSAELLSEEMTVHRLQELAEWGVDLSLVQANLARTPTERAMRMIELLQLAAALRQGYVDATTEARRLKPRLKGVPPPDPPTRVSCQC